MILRSLVSSAQLNTGTVNCTMALTNKAHQGVDHTTWFLFASRSRWISSLIKAIFLLATAAVGGVRSFVGIIYSFYLRSIKHPSWLALITRSDDVAAVPPRESHTQHLADVQATCIEIPGEHSQYYQQSSCGQCHLLDAKCPGRLSGPRLLLRSRNYHHHPSVSQKIHISSLRWDNAETFLLHGEPAATALGKCFILAGKSRKWNAQNMRHL